MLMCPASVHELEQSTCLAMISLAASKNQIKTPFLPTTPAQNHVNILQVDPFPRQSAKFPLVVARSNVIRDTSQDSLLGKCCASRSECTTVHLDQCRLSMTVRVAKQICRQSISRRLGSANDLRRDQSSRPLEPFTLQKPLQKPRQPRQLLSSHASQHHPSPQPLRCTPRRRAGARL